MAFIYIMIYIDKHCNNIIIESKAYTMHNMNKYLNSSTKLLFSIH